MTTEEQEYQEALAEQNKMLAGEKMPFDYVSATDGLLLHMIERIPGLTVKGALEVIAYAKGLEANFKSSQPERGLETLTFFLRSYR